MTTRTGTDAHASPSRNGNSRSCSSSSHPPPVPAFSAAANNSNTNHNNHDRGQPPPDYDYATNGTSASNRHNHEYDHHHHHRRNPSSYSTRAIKDKNLLPHNDYGTSRIAPGHSHRSASRDRPPAQATLPSRGGPAPPPAPSTQPHRRTSSRSTPGTTANHHHHQRNHSSTRHRQPEMPSAAVANNATAAAPSHAGGRDGHHSSSRPSKSRTTIPTQSGKWILGKTIGAGSMGKVKLASKEDTGEQVACKIIPRGSTDDGHQSLADKERADHSKEIRTAREAAIVTLLNHPHICGLRDVVRTNYHWYMLFEFVNGGQMLDYIISHGKLKEKQARKFSRQIASALDYCHRNSIVHRDLKIENILISKNGDIKIIDFGLSNLFSPRGHLKTFCGSLYFAAPELLRAKAYTGPEVDVWSFGIVIYVLVCGKVPFDDQNMQALHDKIKSGIVDYPTWLSSECKHLISRMLVTDPRQRATMQEVMNHPWMVKGFSGPPENYLPTREPLTPPLEPEVVQAMQGFNFGSPEKIQAQLLKIIESEEYQRSVRMYQREREVPPTPKEGEKKRGFGLDFYKRRNSQHSRDTLTAPSSEALQLGVDPMNAFNPLLSIYYLVREKQAREQADTVASSTSVAREKDREKDRERTREKERERERERDRHREKDTEAVPDLPPPQAAHTNSAAYEMPGEKPTGGRTRPRARTHGEDDAPDLARTTAYLPPSDARPEQKEKKEGTAAGLLRRFSTRKRRDPERLEKDRSHPPVVQVHSPSEGAALGPRKSFSIRRSRRDRDEHAEPRLRAGSSQPHHRDLLSPPMSAGGGGRESRTRGLGRSTSVNSAEVRRHQSTRIAKDPPATSGSDQSVMTEQPPTARPGHGHSRSVSMRAKSLGHARRESIQQRRQRREAAHDPNVLEETDLENEQSGPSSDRLLDSSELAKPVFLKGLFSVSTTSGKSVPAIRADIRRVLRQLNVDFVEIKGGFSCKHAPSIDLNKVHDPPMSPGQTPQNKRRFSFGGLRRGEGDRDDVRDAERPPTTPRTPGRSDRDRSDRDRSYSNSETSVDSIPRKYGGPSRRAPGETSTQVQSDLGGSMVLEFEIFIVKVPLLSLHGIQFKRMSGNTWQYKSMADQILKELRL
ncbi:Protein kinase-like protein [Hapsidospora chrysogenum ATCC 11550]|uniref:non-specific serine/threonine protein kinase n=1 Tax=Hapsidospora chrysogenum (strain ATCC 11550 / CBS 779.69 / DSM 880 / IAM 14645 / JCM 23072 / IMI 49137) TaxID=857340 RepID=A0A086T466_HAPC1|nr:Protein kinase-like protein [Hapsidospora chrysogenum ATCC 11550]